jgi:predicted homoserine dehydrogenase-like protein
MNLSVLLAHRAAVGRPVTLALIGAGKFGAMFLAQARRTPGLHVAAVVDVSVDKACNALALTGWPHQSYAAPDIGNALATGATYVTENPHEVIAAPGIELIVEATGSPAAGIEHALACITHGKHLINVTVEADVLVGPLLAHRFTEAGLIYSLAYGDQPALIAELVDWARTSGFDVVCAGKGTKYHPDYRYSTPETVWAHYGITEQRASEGGLNPQIFNSFLDGTKSSIEMAAVANSCDLVPQPEGLNFPPCGVDDLPQIIRPRSIGGQLAHSGTVEVVSSLERDGRPVFRDLRWGVFVVIEACDDYVKRCFADYGMVIDSTGRFVAMYKPYHLIGLELGVSIASVGLLHRPTGAPSAFRGDVVAVAKRDLAPGERLDGEGGYTVYGRLMPAEASLAAGALPIGLAHRVGLRRALARDEVVRWSDVALDDADLAVRTRREMEAAFAPALAAE